MKLFALVVLLALALVLLARWWQRRALARRSAFIRSYRLPPGLLAKLSQRRHGLSTYQQELVARGLRQFFLAYLHGGRLFVAMPSQAVDDLWHEFILYTRHYQQFCQQAFGRFLHHTPAAVLSVDERSNNGLRRMWWQCCKLEKLNPRAATGLPLLFAIDGRLGLTDGFIYHPNCAALNAQDGSSAVYCGADLGSSSPSANGDNDNSSGCSGDSDGGSGCGGGGCGGD